MTPQTEQCMMDSMRTTTRRTMSPAKKRLRLHKKAMQHKKPLRMRKKTRD